MRFRLREPQARGTLTSADEHSPLYGLSAQRMRFISVICVRCAEGLKGKAEMPNYTMKNAIVDLGFIEAYARVTHLPGDDIWFDAFLDALGRVEVFVRAGHLLGGHSSPADLSAFLYDIGFLRGSIWNDKIPYSISEAIKNVIALVSGHHDQYTDRPEPKEEMLSDSDRDVLLNAAEQGECLFSIPLRGGISATQDAIVRYTAQELGAADFREAKEWSEQATREHEAARDPEAVESAPDGTGGEPPPPIKDAEPNAPIASNAPEQSFPVNPFNPNGKRGQRDWTPEQRAEAAERARNQHKEKPPLDSDLEAVKADWEAGVPFAQIGRKWNCSDAHIRNFLKKHGINPNRGRANPKAIEQPAPDAAEADMATAVATIEEEEAADFPAAITLPEPASTPSPLDPDDWPDIQQMLATGKSRQAIASDYDVLVDDLNAFIEAQLKATQERIREKAKEQPLGESLALPPGTVGSAA